MRVGPEPTSIFGGASAMAIGLYVRAGEPPDAARMLIEAFTRFNIPYQSRIASNDMIPDARNRRTLRRQETIGASA